MMNDFEAWNRQVIEEFHANEGKVNGSNSLLLLRTMGARSGKQRVNPLAYTTDGERLVIIASKGGTPTNPDWYHNIVAHPDVTVEVGTETFEARMSYTPNRQQLCPISPSIRRRLHAKSRLSC
jgi:deazaflavin-dependent oxidoreductase (nitroreductase family)